MRASRSEIQAHRYAPSGSTALACIEPAAVLPEPISNARILRSTSMKLKFIVIGLPGKSPVSRAVSTLFPPRSASDRVAVLLLRRGHPSLYRLQSIMGPAFVVCDRIRREALLHRVGIIGI